MLTAVQTLSFFLFSLCSRFEFTLKASYKLHVLRPLMLHIFAAKVEKMQDINNIEADPSPRHHLSKVCAI